jgi:unsaturated chondroitin disaccharide hydrolase
MRKAAESWREEGWPRVHAITGWEDALATSELNAGYWLNNVPEDRVPLWDFDADLETPVPWGSQKDSSAGAISASGLLDLAKQTKSEERSKIYRTTAFAMLDAFVGPTYLAHMEWNKPTTSEHGGLVAQVVDYRQ